MTQEHNSNIQFYEILDTIIEAVASGQNSATLNDRDEILFQSEIDNLHLYARILEDIKVFEDKIFKIFPTQAKTLIIATCPDALLPYLNRLTHQFEQVVVIDKGKAGQTLHGFEIKDPDTIDFSDFLISETAVFISSRTWKTYDYYRTQFSKFTVFNLNDLIASADCLRQTLPNDPVQTILDFVGQSQKTLIYIAPSCGTTTQPTFSALQSKGVKIVWITTEKQTVIHGYSDLSEDDTLFDAKFLLSLPAVRRLLSHKLDAAIMINCDSYPHANWDAKRASMNYIFIASLIQYTEKFGNHLTLQLYDPVKPVLRELEYQSTMMKAYSVMSPSAHKALYNSCIDEMPDFLNGVGLKPQNALCFPRFSVVCTKTQQKRTDGLHIAAISTLLGEFEEPSRSGMRPYVQSVVQQGIHIHYYSDLDRYGAFFDQFIGGLNEVGKRHFHLHEVVRDQEQLVYDISQYHIGWSVFDFQIFWHIVAQLDHQLARDIMQVFPLVTVPTSTLTYASAGLCVLINRCMRGVQDLLPDDSLIRVELSEFDHLKSRVDRMDLKGKLRKGQEVRHKFAAVNQIDELYDFLFNKAPLCD